MNRRRNVNVQDKRQTPQGTPTLDSLARDLTKLAKETSWTQLLVVREK